VSVTRFVTQQLQPTPNSSRVNWSYVSFNF